MCGARLLLMERIELRRRRHIRRCKEAGLSITGHHWMYIVSWTHMLATVWSFLPLLRLFRLLTLCVQMNTTFAWLIFFVTSFLRVTYGLGFILTILLFLLLLCFENLIRMWQSNLWSSGLLFGWSPFPAFFEFLRWITIAFLLLVGAFLRGYSLCKQYKASLVTASLTLTWFVV